MDQWSRDDRLGLLAEVQQGLDRVRAHLMASP
jgi:hypothetical protein